MKPPFLMCSLALAGAVCLGQSVPFTDVFSELPLPGPFVRADVIGANLVVQTDHQIACYAGKGDGTFAASVVSDLVAPGPLVFISAYVASLRLLAIGNQRYKMNTDCTFTWYDALPLDASAIGDFDKGSLWELVGTIPGTNRIRILAGNRSGNYQIEETSLTGLSPKAADLNKDGWSDLVVAQETGGSWVWLADQKGGFIKAQTLVGREWTNLRESVDVNGDGLTDLLFEGGGLALGLGNGSFTLQSAGTCPDDLDKPCDAGGALADFNNDGTLDSIVAPYNAATTTYETVLRIGGMSGLGGPQRLQIPAGVPNGLIARDWNGDGAPDLAVVGDKSIRIYMNMIETRVISSAIIPWSDRIRSVAPGSLATVFGVNYTTQTAAAGSLQALPDQLGGIQVLISDAAGRQFLAKLLYAAPQQINFRVPEEIAIGWSKVELVNATAIRTIGWMEVKETAPSLFYVVTGEKVNPDGTTSPADFSFGVRWPMPAIVTLYGTGFRGATANNTTVLYAYDELPALSVGPHPTLPGVDVITVRVGPESLPFDGDYYGDWLGVKTQGIIVIGFYANFMTP